MKTMLWHVVVVCVLCGAGSMTMGGQIALGLHDGPVTTAGANNDDNISLNNYSGGVLSQTALFTSMSNGGWHVSGTSVGDVDNDGTQELVASYQYQGSNSAAIGVYGISGGNLTQKSWQTLSTGGWSVTGVGVGNANNSQDGSNELVLGWHYGSRNNYENDVVVCYNFGISSLTEIGRSDSWGGGWNINGLGVGNADNKDGDNEIVVSWSYYNGTIGNAADTLQVLDFTNNTMSGVAWDGNLRLDDGGAWDLTGLDIGDADNDGSNEVAVSWRKFMSDGGETGQKLSLYNYTGSGISLESTPIDSASAYWGIQGVGIGNIPEPATMLLLGLGGLALRRKNN